MNLERHGPWALIAGASVGLGAEFARQIARHKLNLVLVSRRAEALAALAAELEAAHGIQTRIVAADLADPQLLAALVPATDGLEIGLLVYNAAYSKIGPFLDQSLDDQLRTLDVNCRGPLLLVHHYGGLMRARRRGGIILMTSLAANQGSPCLTGYAATKAWNLVLAEGLWDELGRDGVDVLACRAGATRTPGFESSRPKGSMPLMEPAPVVSGSLAALGRRPSMVPGWLNKLAVFVLGRLFPRWLSVRIMGGATRKLYRLPG